VSISIEAYLLAISIGEIAAFDPALAGIVSREGARKRLTQGREDAKEDAKKKRRREGF